MEVLSTGEKIKRARVYKGITLKDICGDKISVSKMSCIENNKIKPEPWILEFIADKLDLSMNYLQQDVRQQIKENINGLKNSEFSHEHMESHACQNRIPAGLLTLKVLLLISAN